MVEWKDSTNYSRGKPRVQTMWSADFGGQLSITVTNGHIYHPGRFVMHCRELGIDTAPLPEGFTPEQAQERAIQVVRTKLDRMRAALQGGEK